MSKTIPHIGNRGRPSIRLSNEDMQVLKSLSKNYPTLTEFASSFRINRISFTRILTSGSGSKENITRISRKLSKLKMSA